MPGRMRAKSIAVCFSLVIFVGVTLQGEQSVPSIFVTGSGTTPLTLTAESLAQMPRATATVSSSGIGTQYEGVWLHERGTKRRIRIVAADVSLAVDRPSRTSILNVLPVRVKEIDRLDESQVNIVVNIGHRAAGTRLLARISMRALETLGLGRGQDIYAQVKAVSLIASGSSKEKS